MQTDIYSLHCNAESADCNIFNARQLGLCSHLLEAFVFPPNSDQSEETAAVFCNQCNVTFANVIILKKHKNTLHFNQCNDTFANITFLKKHKNVLDFSLNTPG